MANLTKATLSLWIYKGNFGEKPSNPSYVITKNIIAGEDTIVFEIGELVRDYLDIEFTGDYNNISETAWAEWTILRTYDDTSTDSINGDAIVTGGYGYFEDGINPQLIAGALISNRTIYNYSGQDIYLPVMTGQNGAVSADYYEGATLLRTDTFGSTITPITADLTTITADSTAYTVDMTFSAGTSSSIIVRVIPPTTTDRIVVTLTNGTQETITVKTIEECKYSPYKVSFMNKFGAIQDVWFFKRRDDSINVSKESYRKNTITTSGSDITYSTSNAQKAMIDFDSNKSIVLNTGFIDEEWYKVIKEIMLTEYAWINENGNYYPITPSTNSLQQKKSVNDKLIDYSLEFEYAFQTINNIR